LKIRCCCSLGHCEQDCTAMYRKYFSCFSTVLLCACVKISRWERRIIVIQRRTNLIMDKSRLCYKIAIKY